MQMNRIGVSSGCFYPRLTETVIKDITLTGASVMELFINTHSEMEIDYIKELKEIIDYYGISVCSVHPFTSFAETYLFFSEYPRRTEDGFRIYDRYFEICNILGAKILNFHGFKSEKSIEFEKYCHVYGTLYEKAKAAGVVFSQENVRKFISGDIEFIRRFSDYMKNSVAFTFDIKQAYMSCYDPIEFSKTVVDKLVLVHLNDFDGENTCLLPGKGVFDLQTFFTDLSLSGYTGNYIIEVYSGVYGNDTEIADSVKYAESILKESLL